MRRHPAQPIRTAPPAIALLGLALAAALAPLGGCAPAKRLFSVPPREAVAKLAPVRGHTASGLMTFRPQGRLLLIQGEFTGLTPGSHGLHIHEGGDCGGRGARDAGGHFNPTGARHGSPGAPSHHAGDLPMVTAGADGKARFQAAMDGLDLGDDAHGVIGRTVVVTARPDNFTTQPDGNSGPAVACGVIRER